MVAVFLIAGVGLVFFAPTFAPSLTPARLDYLATFWIETEVARRGQSHAHILPPESTLIAARRRRRGRRGSSGAVRA